jgi:hypothetical protein
MFYNVAARDEITFDDGKCAVKRREKNKLVILP